MYNKEQAANDTPKYQSERDNKKDKPLSRCSYCDVVVIKENYSRRRKKCAATTNDHVTSVPLSLLEVEVHENYNPVFLDRIVANLEATALGRYVERQDFHAHRISIFLAIEREEGQSFRSVEVSKTGYKANS